MDADTASTGKKWYLTAAPQCVYPDRNIGAVLNNTFLDFVSVKFYDNPTSCGLNTFDPAATTQTRFNFATWDNWAKTVSKNKDVKVMMGIPGGPTAANNGYVTIQEITPIIQYVKTFSTFAGVTVWDASQVYANSGGAYLPAIERRLRVRLSKMARMFRL